MIGEDQVKKLLQAAFMVRGNAYAPYSGIAVGAALLTADGKIFCGCNIENTAYDPSICAERAALAQAVSAGYHEFAALAVCGGKIEQDIEELGFFPPCGVCRQTLSEFCLPSMPVYLAQGTGSYRQLTLGELFPYAFGKENLL
jgi:cytidine deaminase